MIAQQQHALTVTNLCEFVQYVSNALDNKKQVDVIYTDRVYTTDHETNMNF